MHVFIALLFTYTEYDEQAHAASSFSMIGVGVGFDGFCFPARAS